MTTTQMENVQLERVEPSHYARIPKIAQRELSPYELALYCNYKQTASEDGECWKSNETLSNETNMSVSQVKRARKGLADKGYIVATPRKKEDGSNATTLVVIVDVWEYNAKTWGSRSNRPGVGSHRTEGSVHIEPMSVLTEPERITPQEQPRKEKPKKKNTPDGNLDFEPIIKAWLDATEIIDPAAYANKTNRTYAIALAKAGYSPTDVANFVHWKRAVESWNTTTISLKKVSEGITSWAKTRRPSPIPPQEAVTPPPPPEENTGEYITPEQVEEFNRMFADLVKSKSANIGVRPS